MVGSTFDGLVVPRPLTSFVGRRAEIAALRAQLMGERVVTLVGAGGVGKTRLAIEAVAGMTDVFDDGIAYVDLAPIADPDLVATTVAHAMGVVDQPGRAAIDELRAAIADRYVLIVLDNCEHLLDACAALVATLVGACPRLNIAATSREPLGVFGELVWPVPPMAPGDATSLFVERALRVRPDFVAREQDSDTVAEICERVDGLPLAIELAAARVRSLSLTHILDHLGDRFGLLTGGARTTLPRHQTMRGSLDWSYEMLPDAEQRMFLHLSVFPGPFDLEAAEAVTSADAIDTLRLLVDKSLVVAQDVAGSMRYRLLETMRQYGAERLGESDDVRRRHRDHYVSLATELAAAEDDAALVAWAEVELDNLRAAFECRRTHGDVEAALRLASALQQFWIIHGHLGEGLSWFAAALTDTPGEAVTPETWARAVAHRSIVAAWMQVPQTTLAQARLALSIAHELDDAGLTASLLNVCSVLTLYDDPVLSQTYLDEAYALGRRAQQAETLCETQLFQAILSNGVGGDPRRGRDAAEESGTLAAALGDRLTLSHSRVWLGCALHLIGELEPSGRVLVAAAEGSAASAQLFMVFLVHVFLGRVRASQGRVEEGRAHADRALAAAADAGGLIGDALHGMVAEVELAAGNGSAAKQACELGWQHTFAARVPFTRVITPMSEALLACGDVVAARRWADDNVDAVCGSYRGWALANRAHVALAQGEPDQAARDAYEALSIAAATGTFLRVPIALECLARLAAGEGRYAAAARLFGAAQGIRDAKGIGRWPVYAVGYDEAVATTRDALGDDAFDEAWAEGAGTTIDDAIAYALRGRGARKRPTSGWDALTPTEVAVVRLVREGLTNKVIAAQLLMSPRTVQTHLTHVYAKLGLNSRVQLIRESARHA